MTVAVLTGNQKLDQGVISVNEIEFCVSLDFNPDEFSKVVSVAEAKGFNVAQLLKVLILECVEQELCEG